jgi:hypothetical protein
MPKSSKKLDDASNKKNWNNGKRKVSCRDISPVVTNEMRCSMKEVVMVSTDEQLAVARKCMVEAAQKGERGIIIKYAEGYQGPLDEQGRKERDPHANCPEFFK